MQTYLLLVFATLIQTLGPCKMGSKLPIVQGVTLICSCFTDDNDWSEADGLTA